MKEENERQNITLAEAKEILGTAATDMSDEDIRNLIEDICLMTEVVVSTSVGSTFNK